MKFREWSGIVCGGFLYEILGPHKINIMWFMTINPREGKHLRKKALNLGKFRPLPRPFGSMQGWDSYRGVCMYIWENGAV